MTTEPRPSRSGILAGGNWIVDHVKIVDRWPAQDALANILAQESANGGSPYNVLKDLARLGATFPLEGIGLVGDDEAGRFIRADCERHGIDAARLRVSATAPTSYTDVMTARDTGRRTFFHHRGANAELGPEHFDFTGSRARIFHLGYMLLLDRLDELKDGETGASAVLRAARAAGMKTSADVVSEVGERCARIVRPALPHIDYLFLNELELAQVTGLETARGGVIDPAAVARAAAELASAGVREWVIVHFPEATLACGPSGERHWQPSVRVPPEFTRGTAGAGDALASGVLYGLHEGWPMPEALRLGVAVAAASLSHPTCSEGVSSLGECLALAAKFGHRSPPVA